MRLRIHQNTPFRAKKSIFCLAVLRSLPGGSHFSHPTQPSESAFACVQQSCEMYACVHREMDVRDADTLLVVGELHELIGAPADAVRCLTAALTRRPSHVDTWLRLVDAQSIYTTGSQPPGIPTSGNCIVSGAIGTTNWRTQTVGMLIF